MAPNFSKLEVLETSFQAKTCANFPKICTNSPKICTNSPKICTNFPKNVLKNIVARFLNNFRIYGSPPSPGVYNDTKQYAFEALPNVYFSFFAYSWSFFTYNFSFLAHATTLGNEKSAQSFSDRSFFMDVHTGCPCENACFSRIQRAWPNFCPWGTRLGVALECYSTIAPQLHGWASQVV